MPHPFDAASKHMFQAHPADWLALGGLPSGLSLQVVDADLSTISKAVDKLIRVYGPFPYIAHFEFQAGPDPRLDMRVLVYNVLSENLLGLETRSVVFLLRPEALAAGVTGRVFHQSGEGHKLDFVYKLVKVWELPVQSLLSAGLGTLPLAPISQVEEHELPGVIDAMKRRFDREAPVEAKELWTATRILMGLRWPPTLVGQLLRGVQGMKESATYQEIVREGMEEGMRKGLEKGFQEGIERGIERGIEKGIEQGIEKGIEKGRAAEARSFLLRYGSKVLGSPDAAISQRLNAIGDPGLLERLMDRVVDRNVGSWIELLGSEA